MLGWQDVARVEDAVLVEREEGLLQEGPVAVVGVAAAARGPEHLAQAGRAQLREVHVAAPRGLVACSTGSGQSGRMHLEWSVGLTCLLPRRILTVPLQTKLDVARILVEVVRVLRPALLQIDFMSYTVHTKY